MIFSHSLRTGVQHFGNVGMIHHGQRSSASCQSSNFGNAAENFLRTLETGKVSTNVYLRRIHNFALDMTWLPWPVIVKRQWPKVEFKDKRAITWEEHQAIVTRELNPERKAFYKLAWHLGASQTDLACLEAENIDWEHNVISFARKKTGSVAIMRFDEDVAQILRDLPGSGPLFPDPRQPSALATAPPSSSNDAGVGLGIKGVRRCIATVMRGRNGPKKAGYPERFAMENLGQNSKAVHRAYSRKAQVELPSLGEHERRRKAFANGHGVEPVPQAVIA